jgi:subtilisin
MNAKSDESRNARSEEGRRPETSTRGTSRAGARKRLASRHAQYLVAPVSPSINEQALAERLERLSERCGGVEVLRTIASQTSAGPPVAVIRLKPEQVPTFRQSAGEALWVERDVPLQLASFAAAQLAAGPARPVYAVGKGFTANIQVFDEDDEPLEGAEVQLSGADWTAQGFTGSDGKAELPLYGELPETTAELLIRSRTGTWGLWKQSPDLQSDGVATVSLRALPKPANAAWGAATMGFDRLPSDCDGSGVKIALVDTGVATTHEQLRGVAHGTDAVRGEDRSWSQDPVGHGTSCAGILVAEGTENSPGGYAAGAELHVFKLPLDARCSDLLAALDACIQAGIDLVCLGYGSEFGSAIVEQRVAAAKERGIAVIASAGNTAQRVQFPACSTHVLAVGAIGRTGSFPDDSPHAAHEATAERVGGGAFVPAFSGYGPELDLCAPGVSVICCQSPDGYAAWDGTSLAAAHVTALAALVLAHHTDFQNQFAVRNAIRVERLFQLLKQTAQALADPLRTGAGVPYAPHALGLQLQPQPHVASLNAALGDMREALRRAGLSGKRETLQPPRGPATTTNLPLNLDPPIMMRTSGARGGLPDLKAAMQRAGLFPAG